MTSSAQRGTGTVTQDGPPPPLTQQETLADLLTQSGRGAVPIRTTFVQQGRGKKTTPGLLASFIGAHDGRALDAYLFIHALASSSPWDCEYPSGTWIRAFGLAEAASLTSARGAVSKIMKRLEDRRLIARGRSGRRATVTLLREDGSGKSYDRPTGASDTWFSLPHAYWLQKHHRDLSLPAKAMLLVSLSLQDDFYLPFDKAEAWYGISSDSAGRGMRELEEHGLLHYRQLWRKNQRSDTGWREERHYTLGGPYAAMARKQAAGKRSRGAGGSRTDTGSGGQA